MATFTWTPDYPASSERTPRVKSVRFGDGYEQRIGDGLNTLLPSWSLSFSFRETAEIDALEAFLITHAGVHNFTWTPPRSTTAGRYICRSWTRTVERGNLDTLRCEMEAVADNA